MSAELEGKTALVTGASSGLGVDFSRELAAKGANLILVARRTEKLQAVADELFSLHGVNVGVITADLADCASRISLFEQIQRSGHVVDILVNNAGFGVFGDFLSIPWEREHQMLKIDIVALANLTKLFVPGMVERGDGHVLQVSSIGAFQPSPTYGSYSAAKSYVLNFSESLNFELRGTGVSCTAVCPGVTATEFLQVSGQQETWFQRATMMKSADVARIGVKSMLRRQAHVVPGRFNALMAFMTRLTPRPVLAQTVHLLMKN